MSNSHDEVKEIIVRYGRDAFVFNFSRLSGMSKTEQMDISIGGGDFARSVYGFPFYVPSSLFLKITAKLELIPLSTISCLLLSALRSGFAQFKRGVCLFKFYFILCFSLKLRATRGFAFPLWVRRLVGEWRILYIESMNWQRRLHSLSCCRDFAGMEDVTSFNVHG